MKQFWKGYLAAILTILGILVAAALLVSI